MARFEEAVLVVLRHEGGFVDDPRDPGGTTHFGISLRFLRGLGDLDGDGIPDGDLDRDGDVDPDDVRKMTVLQATAFYRLRFWRPAYAAIGDQQIATKILDLAVNVGPGPAHRIVQRALRACGWELKEDGDLGPHTMTALGRTNPVTLLAAIRAEAAGFYRTLGAKRADLRWAVPGLLNRAYS